MSCKDGQLAFVADQLVGFCTSGASAKTGLKLILNVQFNSKEVIGTTEKPKE